MVWCAGSVFFAIACGESEESGGSTGSGGDSGTGATPTGGSAGLAGAGASQGGASQGGMSGGTSGAGGAQGGSGASIPAACMDRTSNHVPGTRIRPKNLVTSEGDRSWQGWHDSELGEDCEFVRGSDGVDRCMPVAAPAYGAASFADAGCSEEIVPLLSCSPTHVRKDSGTSSCDFGENRVHELGATVTLSMVYLGTPGACSPTPVDPPQMFFRLGAEVDSSSHVEASTEILPGAGRVRSEGISAADGTLQVRGWVDTQFDTKCGFETLDSDVEYCVPEWSFSPGYAEPECTTQVLLEYGCREGERTPSYAFLPGTAPCYTNRLVTVGEAYSGTVYTQSCYPFNGEVPPAYAVGADAPASLAPAVTQTVALDDPSRLKPVYKTSDDGGCWFWTWFDSELDVDCGFQEFTDGTHRCAPSPWAEPLDTFSDDACTVEAKVAAISACTTAPAPKYAMRFEGDFGCRRVAEVFPTGEVLGGTTPPARWVMSDTGCVPASLSADSRYVAVGARLDPSSFMAGELRVE